ncbi:universal stress protein UspA [Clostridium formicaceticum]|uniref:Sensor protein KdpD n=1 Tax=Clostridium formicaceticum TaxID=1497 RepID=A0AAC9RPQ1_9CLOT|nr:universal stress protein UspA [Clostridium formicaceticum]AOY78098.1 universal stress protein UspA [Clostridium formicaceticum]ARE88748.1 sensor protein KdpD [Clostridium formicaceticum]
MENENTMICVTQQKTCERLIKAGVQIKEKQGGGIFVVHVAPIGWSILGNSKEGEALDYLFDISKEVGAHMTVLRSSDVVKTIIDFCQKHNIKTIVLGESKEKSTENNIIMKLSKKICNDVDLKIISTD